MKTSLSQLVLKMCSQKHDLWETLIRHYRQKAKYFIKQDPICRISQKFYIDGYFESSTNEQGIKHFLRILMRELFFPQTFHKRVLWIYIDKLADCLISHTSEYLQKLQSVVQYYLALVYLVIKYVSLFISQGMCDTLLIKSKYKIKNLIWI